MTRPIIAASFLLSAALFFPETGQTQKSEIPADSPLTVADLAWERGDYRTALSGYLRLLDSPDAARVLEPIALRTGELYETTELTRDGVAPEVLARRKIHRVRNRTDRHARHPCRVLGRTHSNDRRAAGLRRIVQPGRLQARLLEDVCSEPATATRCASTPSPRRQRRHQRHAPAGRLALYDIATAQETALDTGELTQSALFVGAGDIVLFSARLLAARRARSTSWLRAGRSRRSPPTRPTRSSSPSTRRALRCSSRRARRAQAAAGVAHAPAGGAARRRPRRGRSRQRRQPSASCRFLTARWRRSREAAPSFSPDGTARSSSSAARLTRPRS